MRPRILPHPDFVRFRDTLLLRAAHRRPPLFDFHIHASHMTGVLGRPALTGSDVVEFYRLAGYDYAQISICCPMNELHAAQRQQQADGAASHGALRVISTLDDFRSRRWSWQPVAEGDFSAMSWTFQRLEEVCAALPPQMKILLHTADIFTFAWELLGFDELCLASYEQPELVDALMASIATAQTNLFRESLRRAGDRVGVLFYSDDIAYTEGLMLSPDFYAQYLFPRMKVLAEMGRSRDLPFIYHSDGKLYQVFDHLAGVGVQGIQPLEPKSMDPLEIKRHWPGKFCLLGNIDLDLMSRGTPEQVEAHVRNRIDTLNVGGGYMPGVSNTVPDYVNHENYIRMIETVYGYDQNT